MTRTAALLTTLAAVLFVTGFTVKCAKPDAVAGYEAVDASSARRKSKRWRKVHRARYVAPAPKPKAATPTEFTAVGASLSPAFVVERAHQQIPPRAIGAELMQPVPASYIAVRALAEMQPETEWPQQAEPEPAWRDTHGGKATILAAFFGIIAACGLGTWRARHG